MIGKQSPLAKASTSAGAGDNDVESPRLRPGAAYPSELTLEIASALAKASSFKQGAARVLKLICEMGEWDSGRLWLVEAETRSFVPKSTWLASSTGGQEVGEMAPASVLSWDSNSLPGKVRKTGQTLWVADLSLGTPHGSAHTVSAGKDRMLSAAVFQVRSAERLIAIVECRARRVRPPEPDSIEQLTRTGNQIGIFLEQKLIEENLTLRIGQQELLAQAGIALSTSFDYEKRLASVAELVVPDLADWCALDIVDPSGSARRLAAAHVDPTKTRLIYALQRGGPPDPKRESDPRLETLRKGKSLLMAHIPESVLEESARDPEELEIILTLAARSAIIVPLNAHGRILGAFSLVMADSGRRYGPSDLILAEDLARRVALALDNAQLYTESHNLNIELEKRVASRTAQLEKAYARLTDQIAERRQAEEQVQLLNQGLEKRVAERTAQLETLNEELKTEVAERKLAGQKLATLLRRTRELYRISKAIGSVRTPNEVMHLLLTSSFLREASRASIAIFDHPWLKKKSPPAGCTILDELNKDSDRPVFIGQHFTLEEYGIARPLPTRWPLVLQDIQANSSLPEAARRRFADLETSSVIIIPLFAGGEWYGLLSLHFQSRRITNVDDLQHIRGLVDEAAVAINNIRLLEGEARARREAEQANSLKLKFLAMISHELRTPLASIKGFATTLLAEDIKWDPDSQHDFLKTIDEESDKLGELIEQLLDLSRMEAGTLRISPQVDTLNNILASAMTQLQMIASQHELVLEVPPDLPTLFVDGQRIAQILTNLVNNAAKYSQPQTRITLAARLADELVQVDVTDQGPGIPPQDRERVFEAFRQLETRGSRRTGGAGLGLAICKGLIQAHGGRIWIQDRPEPGTLISFTLPTYESIKSSLRVSEE